MAIERAMARVAGIDVTGAQLLDPRRGPARRGRCSAWFLNRTMFGKSVKAAAENRDLARLSGINPKRVSLLVWTIAGVPGHALDDPDRRTGRTRPATWRPSGPSTLVRASPPRSSAAWSRSLRAFFAGIAHRHHRSRHHASTSSPSAGLIDFLLFIAVLVAVYFQSRQRR